MKYYYVYVTASANDGALYIGMTNNLVRRIYEHKNEIMDGFTKKYKCKKLVYFESSNDIKVVLEREKQLKRWRRSKEITLIQRVNPNFVDLSTLALGEESR